MAKNRFSQNQKTSVFSVIKEIPGSFRDIVGTPFFRGSAAIASAITRKPFTPTGRFQQELYGGKEPITPAKVGQEFRGGIGGKEPLKIDPALGIIAGSLDAIPGGKQVKGAVGAVEEAISPVNKLIQALKLSKPLQKELKTAQTAERASRASKVSEIFSKQQGQKGFFRGLGELKGQLTPEDKRVFEAISLKQEDVDSLFNDIQANSILDSFEKISAGNGLQKIFNGELPQPSQVSLLEDVFGQDLIKELMDKRPMSKKVLDGITEAINIPRALITSFDMSAPLRQGVILTTSRPKSALKASKEMFRQVFSPKNYNAWLDDLTKSPEFKGMKKAGLYIADTRKIAGGLTAREEGFMTNIAQKIPILGAISRASERAYTSYLNKIRVDTYKDLATKFNDAGVADESTLKSLASFINNATGRGDLGAFERSAQVLNNVFFSPRLIAARFNMLNPVWYMNQQPAVRKEAVKSFIKFIGVGTTVLSLMSANKNVDVETDPRSSDFGKIRVGNVRWDVWGGFQQWVRVASQLASGERKATTGKIIKLDKSKFPFESRLDVGASFFRGKLAPLPSLALELLDGQKMFGEELKVGNEVFENVVPLYLQDIGEAIKELGPEALISVGLPSFFGVGTQVYKKQKASGNRFNR